MLFNNISFPLPTTILICNPSLHWKMFIILSDTNVLRMYKSKIRPTKPRHTFRPETVSAHPSESNCHDQGKQKPERQNPLGKKSQRKRVSVGFYIHLWYSHHAPLSPRHFSPLHPAFDYKTWRQEKRRRLDGRVAADPFLCNPWLIPCSNIWSLLFCILEFYFNYKYY